MSENIGMDFSFKEIVLPVSIYGQDDLFVAGMMDYLPSRPSPRCSVRNASMAR